MQGRQQPVEGHLRQPDGPSVQVLQHQGTYNWGEYKSVELAGGKGVGSGSYNPMNRFVVGAWYDNPKGLNLRAEYGHMKSAVGGVDVVKENGAYVLAGWHLASSCRSSAGTCTRTA